MTRSWFFPVLGVGLAIAITTTMDASGLTMFSALPLFALAAALWAAQRLARREVGLAWGGGRHYVPALLHPMVVLSVAALVALLAGATDTADANWRTAWLNVLAGGTLGIVMALITEEGFFRGWLWGSLERAGLSPERTLVWTSVAFALWHVSVVTLDTGFDLPARQIPVYLANVLVIGGTWGMLRLASGSAVVPSVAHAVWNALVYPLFGFGNTTGALGISRTHVFGPEVGVVGLGLNIAFAATLWWWLARRMPVSHPASSEIT